MKRMIMLLTVAIMMLCLPGCDQGELYHIAIKNMTGVEISALYLAPETNSGNMQNYLTENLAIDGTVDLSLGRLTEDDVSQGFVMEACNAEDGSSENFGMLMIGNGSTVTLYLDVWGLAVAVDMTEKEVREEIERAKKDAQFVGELTE